MILKKNPVFNFYFDLVIPALTVVCPNYLKLCSHQVVRYKRDFIILAIIDFKEIVSFLSWSILGETRI